MVTLSDMADNIDPHAKDREQLIQILREVEASINAQSLDGMVQQMDAKATVVWANCEVSRGPAEILAYYDRMVKAKGAILTKYTTKAELSGPARFLGDGTVAIADGEMEDEFTPVIRGPFRLRSRWTTTIAKIDGQWKVVGLHLSANVFNNVLLDEAKRALLYAGAAGVVLGMLLCWLLGRLL
ncbi:MAG: hypothetical protein HYX27_13100 [Acidobacteria bacterium]|nr:hypothetical protein [Acidobacteriota bacterium]